MIAPSGTRYPSGRSGALAEGEAVTTVRRALRLGGAGWRFADTPASEG